MSVPNTLYVAFICGFFKCADMSSTFSAEYYDTVNSKLEMV
jgi:hypothetical protein